MSQMNAAGTQDPTTLQSMGAVVSTIDPENPNKPFTYVASYAQDPEKGLTLELTEESKRAAAQPQAKPYNKYALLNELSAQKPGQSRIVSLQQRGLDASRRRQPNLSALKARMPVTSAPKPQPAPKPVTIAPTMTMASNQMMTTKNVMRPHRPRSIRDSYNRLRLCTGFMDMQLNIA